MIESITGPRSVHEQPLLTQKPLVTHAGKSACL